MLILIAVLGRHRNYYQIVAPNNVSDVEICVPKENK